MFLFRLLFLHCLLPPTVVKSVKPLWFLILCNSTVWRPVGPSFFFLIYFFCCSDWHFYLVPLWSLKLEIYILQFWNVPETFRWWFPSLPIRNLLLFNAEPHTLVMSFCHLLFALLFLSLWPYFLGDLSSKTAIEISMSAIFFFSVWFIEVLFM